MGSGGLTLICPLQSPAKSIILNHPHTSGIPYSKTVKSTDANPKTMSLAESTQDPFALCQTLKIIRLEFCKKKKFIDKYVSEILVHACKKLGLI
jgi:hypothetical protein